MAGSLTIEVDDDVLVENAAAATLFSPGMWVQRPSTRAAAAARGDVEMADAPRCVVGHQIALLPAAGTGRGVPCISPA